jgi:HD-like signal output (HDOD) protein
MQIDKVLLANLSEEENRKVLRLVEKGVRIPPQPRVLGELSRLAAHGAPDLRVLAATIAEDPGISSLLFKAVQSAVYRAHAPINSIERILQMIGVAPTINLIRAIALSSPSPGGRKLQALEAFWSRSRAVAQIAMLIAEDRVAVCNIFPDQAYLAGVFHDCGVAVLMQRFLTYCKDLHLDEPGRWPNVTDEDARYSADHAVVGYLIARHWQLPDFVCDAIRFHHDFAHMDEHPARTMVAMLQLAIHIYCRNNMLANPEWAGVREAALVELGIHDDALPEFIDVILERYQGS